MNAREANVFLTEAAHLDPRMKRVDAEEQANTASMWAEVLADVALDVARSAMRRYYRAATVPIMPAHVLELAGIADAEESPYEDITHQVIDASKWRALAAAGVTAEEYAEHEHDVEWIRARFRPVAEIIIGFDSAASVDENGDPE